jgi:phosphopantetheinyl transferase
MPLIHQQVINQNIQLGVWHINEPLSFFTKTIVLQKNIMHPHKQLQHAAGRYLLTLLQPNFPINEVVIAKNNRPYLPNKQFYFSISHCSNYAAAIISSTNNVGIDVEIPTTKVLKVLHKFLSPIEKNIFKVENSTTANILLPTVLWSAKEALFKWWGNGEIDFREHLQINSFELLQQGSFTAKFLAHQQNENLWMHYKVFDEFVLVYTSL